LNYRSRDPDSRLYTEIAGRLAERPLTRWIAPEWPVGSYVQGLFLDHPAGLFLPAAALVRLGYPADQASYAVGLAFGAATFALLPSVAAAFAPEEARTLGWLLQLLPIFFVFRVRANHEPPLLLFLLVALLGAERVTRYRRGGLPLLTVALAGVMLVKGFLVLPAAACCGLWILVRSRAEDPRLRPRWWITGPAVAAGLGATALGYEWAYRQATGRSFLAGYAQRSLSIGASEGHAWSAWTVPYNAIFYTGRILWFAFPWSLVFVAAVAWAARRFRSREPSGGLSSLGLVFVLAVATVYVGLFSLSGRRAERYIYPVYLLVGAAGAVAALRRWPVLARLAQRARGLEPLAPVVLWLTLVALHVAGGYLDLPRIKLWNP
jgi:hypothetical protein